MGATVREPAVGLHAPRVLLLRLHSRFKSPDRPTYSIMHMSA